MQIVYGYLWGIWWWRTSDPGIRANAFLTTESRLPFVNTGLRSLRRDGLDDVYQAGLAQRIPSSIPVDIVSSGAPHYSNSTHVLIHRWNGFVPIWSLCTLDPKVPLTPSSPLVCSPEFCLLQVSATVRTYVREKVEPWQMLVILIELCCEFCGTYSKDISPQGFKNRAQPLTSVSSLTLFAGRIAHEAYAPKFFTMLHWTLDNLHSPMETALYLMLCLPARYGGLGLVRPFSNFKLEVPQSLWAKTRLRSICPDLFWPEARLIVEYDSDKHHKGSERQDQERQELAQDMGYRVITFRPSDLASSSRFRAKAQSVARYLRRELPPASDEFNQLQTKLRDMLLFHERWL